MREITAVLLLFTLYLTGCKKDEPVPHVNLGYSYFPLETGRWIIYDVDSIDYNAFTQKVDTFKFQIKEIQESWFTDASGEPAMRIERWYRKNTSDAWIIKDVWAANRTTTTAERVEEDMRIVKLAFPVKNKSRWDGNAKNINDEMMYKYDNVHLPDTINAMHFDSAAFVLQQADSNLIEKKYSLEVYAAKVGLIYKRFYELNSTGNFSVPFDQRITSGVKYSYTVNSYGKN